MWFLYPPLWVVLGGSGVSRNHFKKQGGVDGWGRMLVCHHFNNQTSWVERVGEDVVLCWWCGCELVECGDLEVVVG